MQQSNLCDKKGKKRKGGPQKKIKKSHTQKVSQFFGQINQHKQIELSNRIKNYCGKNFPITYRPEYLFTEQWETNRVSENSNQNNLIEMLGSRYLTYSIVTMVLYALGVWTVSIERYFQTKTISSNFPLFQLLLVVNLVDIIIRTCVHYNHTQICLDLKGCISFFYPNFILMAYSLTMIICNIQHLFMNIVELLIIYFLYHKAAQIYGHFKIMEFGLQYENYLKIFDLLLNIFIQAHIFAILLFSASKIDPNENWISSIGIQNETPIVKYINSIYFACTTMLTIGYGDISPKSVGEKCVTIVIEIVGVIAFGYLLNEMGHTLSKMREESEVIERDLQTISKISKYYNLQTKLQNKARNFIVNNKRNNQQLKIQDENRLLLKLNEDLRHEINLENSLNVVKSCIFYLCHWSKSMQNEIAQRLEKRVFSPNELVLPSSGKEDRIYIIKKGRVDVSMSRYGSNQEHRKVMKIINTQTKNHVEVSDNIFGYTKVFSNRPVRLVAVAKDFTSTYSVSKSDILFCVHQNHSDFEYYHQIKSRIDQSVFCEEWQAPSIKNVREHYCPSHILIIKKYRKEMDKTTNSRQSGSRLDRKLKTYKLVANLYNKTRVTGEFPKLSERTLQFTTEKPTNIDSIRQVYSEDSIDSGESENISKKCHELVNLRLKFIGNSLQETESKSSISAEFQVAKEYNNFFKLNNLERVLLCLQKDNSMENRLTQAEETMHWEKTVSFFTSFAKDSI